MPIVGLTTNGAAFPRIGELRKGAAKPSQGNRPGKDLTYFRFTSTNDSVVSKFGAEYGNEPQSVNIFLPYATTDENFEAWQEEWGAGSLKHRCDGKHVVMIQRNGQYVQPEPKTVECPGRCKQVGRLKVIVPELGRLAYVVALTTSVWDIMEVHSNLTAYEALRGDLRGIPFILSRVPRMISTPGKDGRVRREKWLWHIEAAPEWVTAQLSVMQRQALPIPTTLALAETIDGDTGEIIEPSSEPEIIEVEPPAEKPAPEPLPTAAKQPAKKQAVTPAANGGIDWKSRAMGKTFSAFASCLVNAGIGYNGNKHVENALGELGEEFAQDDTERLWDALVARKLQPGQEPLFATVSSADGAYQ